MIHYTYDAAGTKRRVVHQNGSDTPMKQYCENKVYDGTTLTMIMHETGYLTKENGTWKYFYYLKDHVGSNRLVLDDQGGVVQINNFYPYGLTQAEPTPRTDQAEQPYKFGGKELDRDFGVDVYDFEARMYNPAIGRFMQPDPLAEKYYSISPYAYCANNPVRYLDPTGMDWVENKETGEVVWKEEYTKNYVPKGWTYVGTEYMGLSVKKYEVPNYVDKNTLGVRLDLAYNGEDGDYQWVQTIETNYPQDPRIKSPYVDPTPADDDLPYYHKGGNTSFLNKDGNDVTFYDSPSRLGGTDTYWDAELSLVKKTGLAKTGETTPNHYDPVFTLSYGFNAENRKTNQHTLRIVKNPSAFHLNSINQKVQYPTKVPIRRR